MFHINRYIIRLMARISLRARSRPYPQSRVRSPFRHALIVVQGAFVCVGENVSCIVQPCLDSRPCRPLRPSRQVKEILEGVSSSKWGRASVASWRGEAKPFGRQGYTRKQRLRPPGPRQRRGPTQVVRSRCQHRLLCHHMLICNTSECITITVLVSSIAGACDDTLTCQD